MSRRSSPLEVATYEVVNASAGQSMSWEAGELVVDIESLHESTAGDQEISSIEVDLVRPGDSVRIANVLDAVQPYVKADSPDTTFPGALGRLAPAGRGRSNLLSGVAVLVSDLNHKVDADEQSFAEAFVDMAGPGADSSAWGSTSNVVLTLTPRQDVAPADADRAFRRAALRAARDLAAATIGAEPSSVEVIGSADRSEDLDLPSVAAIFLVGSEGPLLDTYYYGHSMLGMSPTLADPRVVLDGALTNGAYEWAASRNPTAFYQRSALIRELFAADGKRLRFVGVILALAYLSTAFEKQRSAMLSAELAERLGADGVVCTTFATGNSQTDTMLTVRACESLGIRTCAIVGEREGGLTDHVPEADCIASAGNQDELVSPWTPERVIGAKEARIGKPVPTSSYLGGLCQLGDMRWMAAPA